MPLGEHADSLLHPDAGSESVLKLGNGDREPLRLAGLARLVGDVGGVGHGG